jgi:hypothetical protein
VLACVLPTRAQADTPGALQLISLKIVGRKEKGDECASALAPWQRGRCPELSLRRNVSHADLCAAACRRFVNQSIPGSVSLLADRADSHAHRHADPERLLERRAGRCEYRRCRL